MNNHEKFSTLLPFYVSGQITKEERQQLKAHLDHCNECRESLEMWQAVSEVMTDDYEPVHVPSRILENALVSIREDQVKANIFLKIYQLIMAQIPLVNKEIWPTSLLILLLGFTITIIADKAVFLFALAPLVSAGGLALIYGKEQDPAYELVLSTPTSQIQILLARSVLVFGFNFVLVAAFSLGLSLYYSVELILLLIMAWLAPMTFLSALGLCLSIFSNSEYAIFISYFCWLSRYVMSTPESRALLGHTGEMFLLFWQSPTALYGVSITLFAAMMIYMQGSVRSTRHLT